MSRQQGIEDVDIYKRDYSIGISGETSRGTAGSMKNKKLFDYELGKVRLVSDILKNSKKNRFGTSIRESDVNKSGVRAGKANQNSKKLENVVENPKKKPETRKAVLKREESKISEIKKSKRVDGGLNLGICDNGTMQEKEGPKVRGGAMGTGYELEIKMVACEKGESRGLLSKANHSKARESVCTRQAGKNEFRGDVNRGRYLKSANAEERESVQKGAHGYGWVGRGDKGIFPGFITVSVPTRGREGVLKKLEEIIASSNKEAGKTGPVIGGLGRRKVGKTTILSALRNRGTCNPSYTKQDKKEGVGAFVTPGFGVLLDFPAICVENEFVGESSGGVHQREVGFGQKRQGMLVETNEQRARDLHLVVAAIHVCDIVLLVLNIEETEVDRGMLTILKEARETALNLQKDKAKGSFGTSTKGRGETSFGGNALKKGVADFIVLYNRTDKNQDTLANPTNAGEVGSWVDCYPDQKVQRPRMVAELRNLGFNVINYIHIPRPSDLVSPQLSVASSLAEFWADIPLDSTKDTTSSIQSTNAGYNNSDDNDSHRYNTSVAKPWCYFTSRYRQRTLSKPPHVNSGYLFNDTIDYLARITYFAT